MREHSDVESDAWARAYRSRVEVFVLFKQKTVDEMRIGDRNSDVGSSDLAWARGKMYRVIYGAGACRAPAAVRRVSFHTWAGGTLASTVSVRRARKPRRSSTRCGTGQRGP